MRDIRFLLGPRYTESRALIIGINKYRNVSPLSYAVNDAEGFRSAIIEDLGFNEKNIVLLLDEHATRENISRSFLRFSADDVGLDDRLLIFFAGHGTTRTGLRGETGYLVPVDADLEDLSTLLRWDDLTRNADLIRAKHMLFIMDACYGGLALTRRPQAGSARFLKDMLLRYSRQVLTAGKADEVVADSGGPIPGHSVFTGHLIEGLQGRAATEQGIITASGLMSYVYSKVATDKNSNQTPHFGHFDGDGDLILIAPGLNEFETDRAKDIDSLLVVPHVEEDFARSTTELKVQKVKNLLSSNESSIQLHEFVASEVRLFLSSSSEDNFIAQTSFSQEEFISRLSRYEEITQDLSVLLACIAHWARPADRQILKKALSRSTDRLGIENGLSAWISLRWYPLIIQIYCAGIAAIDGERFDSLADIFLAPTESDHRQEQEFLVEGAGLAILEINRANLFKRLPGHEQQYTPMSEYLFKLVQPRLDDVLFLGKKYEQVFDEFEVLFALVIADLREARNQGIWGPIGRFGWKVSSTSVHPLKRVIEKFEDQGANWGPLRSGLFGGDVDRFRKVATGYSEMIKGLNWW